MTVNILNIYIHTKRMRTFHHPTLLHASLDCAMTRLFMFLVYQKPSLYIIFFRVIACSPATRIQIPNERNKLRDWMRI